MKDDIRRRLSCYGFFDSVWRVELSVVALPWYLWMAEWCCLTVSLCTVCTGSRPIRPGVSSWFGTLAWYLGLAHRIGNKGWKAGMANWINKLV